MNFPTKTIGCALTLLGIALGYFAKTTLLRATPGMQNPAAAVGGAMPSSKSSSANAGTSDKIPQLVTMDTLESLMAQGDGVSYAALALWLLDANSAEIAAFWENFQKGDPSYNLINLVFINWTRIDPMSALNAVKGTDNEWRAWWAWAAHDPATAMAAASPYMRKHVAKGAGEFNPQWVRENFDSIPEDVRMIAIEGIRIWKEDENHAATMDFLVHHGSSPGVLFGAFARKDPWGAIVDHCIIFDMQRIYSLLITTFALIIAVTNNELNE